MRSLSAEANFNPRPPWGGRRLRTDSCSRQKVISIHALRGEGDAVLPEITSAMPISIHALRGEGDASVRLSVLLPLHFNPRPPWGGRRVSARGWRQDRHFNPRPPWGGRRSPTRRPSVTRTSFQSTPSVGRATMLAAKPVQKESHFNPRPPWGGRLTASLKSSAVSTFQSTPSVGRATIVKVTVAADSSHFNPRPPWGGRLVAKQ